MGPLLGHNTNVRHRGKTYHVQTEDSGIKRPHIFTHCFADGGRVVASRKAAYGHLVDTPAYPDAVRELMRHEHKALIDALTTGELDEVLSLNTKDGRLADATIRNVVAPEHPGEPCQHEETPGRDATAAGPPEPATRQQRPLAPTPSDTADSSAELDIAALERAAEKLLKASPLFNPKRESSPPASEPITPEAGEHTKPPDTRATVSHSLCPSSAPAAPAPSEPTAPAPVSFRTRTRSTAGRYQSGPHQVPAGIDIIPPKPALNPPSNLRQHTLNEVILSYLNEEKDDDAKR